MERMAWLTCPLETARLNAKACQAKTLVGMALDNWRAHCLRHKTLVLVTNEKLRIT